MTIVTGSLTQTDLSLLESLLVLVFITTTESKLGHLYNPSGTGEAAQAPTTMRSLCPPALTSSLPQVPGLKKPQIYFLSFPIMVHFLEFYINFHRIINYLPLCQASLVQGHLPLVPAAVWPLPSASEEELTR